MSQKSLSPIRRLGILLLLLASPMLAAEDKKDKPKFEMTKAERRLMELVNEVRTKADLPALRANELLFEAARKHSANMAKQRKMEHNLDGKRPAQRVEDAGYDWGKVAENLITADDTDVPLDKIVESWMDSKIHRENILLKDVTETGLGIATNGRGDIYYTQLFARPRKGGKHKK